MPGTAIVSIVFAPNFAVRITRKGRLSDGNSFARLAKVAGEEPGQQLLQRLQQRLQRSFVRAPASDRAVINRLANLGRARGPNGSLRPMKIETRIVPIEPAMGDDSARLRLEAADYLLVVHVKYHAGHYSMPMCHELLIAAAIAAELP